MSLLSSEIYFPSSSQAYQVQNNHKNRLSRFEEVRDYKHRDKEFVLDYL